MKRIDWEDLGSTALALYLIAMTIYPAMSGETVMMSVHDGTIWAKSLNVGFAFLAARHRGRKAL